MTSILQLVFYDFRHLIFSFSFFSHACLTLYMVFVCLLIKGVFVFNFALPEEFWFC